MEKNEIDVDYYASDKDLDLLKACVEKKDNIKNKLHASFGWPVSD